MEGYPEIKKEPKSEDNPNAQEVNLPNLTDPVEECDTTSQNAINANLEELKDENSVKQGPDDETKAACSSLLDVADKNCAEVPDDKLKMASLDEGPHKRKLDEEGDGAIAKKRLKEETDDSSDDEEDISENADESDTGSESTQSIELEEITK